eukprot:3096416-Pyramimonas_sp.AAC.1
MGPPPPAEGWRKYNVCPTRDGNVFGWKASTSRRFCAPWQPITPAAGMGRAARSPGSGIGT